MSPQRGLPLHPEKQRSFRRCRRTAKGRRDLHGERGGAAVRSLPCLRLFPARMDTAFGTGCVRSVKTATAESMSLLRGQGGQRDSMSAARLKLVLEAGLFQFPMKRTFAQRKRKARAEPVMLSPDDDAVKRLAVIFDLELCALGEGRPFDQRPMFGQITEPRLGRRRQYAGDGDLNIDRDALRALHAKTCGLTQHEQSLCPTG